ncbi:uncharacterized protein F5147DRAFT_181063 [Suillus discolor]|uniref:G domain-containing protein n=1 Tax=Suillus discolor TaxID=1912936 RepID=A0A9P7F7F6_9AGAM|nr:uncharacterized protein F5147DRAFT_181063 [Suillus discolor]KAG2108037.1 hypothetical protein F5147DRAFT_181063 [Suillus discolor]
MPLVSHKVPFLRLILSRFRILVIGKSGLGKSSLISHAFGVGKEIFAHNKLGEASIDKELISPRNERFVLHDCKACNAIYSSVQLLLSSVLETISIYN